MLRAGHVIWCLLLAALLGGGCRLDEVMIPPPAVELPESGPGDTRSAEAARPEGGGTPDAAEVAPVTPITDASDAAAAVPATGGTGGDVAAEVGAEADTAALEVAPVDPLVLGLVARWRFDEGQGMQADDDTGNGNVATLHNGARWEKSDLPGGGGPAGANFAVRLDGMDDYLTASISTIPPVPAAKSIAFWLAADPAPAASEPGQRSCVSLYGAAERSGIQVGLDRGRLAAWFRGQDHGFVVAPGVAAAGFHHLAYTFDGQTHRLYVDGNAAGDARSEAPEGKVTALFVGSYEVPFEMCGGALDDLRIYDRALTPDEARRLAGR